MSLVFAIKSLSTRGGGAERVFAQVVNGLAKRGRDIKIVALGSDTSESFYPISEHIPRLDLGSDGNAFVDPLSLRRGILSLDPRLVVAFMPSSYVPISFALLGSGVPVIASEHNVSERYRGSPIKWSMLNASACTVSQYTAVSDQARGSYPRWIRRRMIVVPNPVSEPSGIFADVGGGLNAKRLLAVGRLHPQKDHITLIRAFAQIAQDFPDWHLRILGEGNQRALLEAEKKKLGVDERVKLPGAVKSMDEEYAGAQLYVIPSLYESQGLATVEAMAFGLPAIGFADCPGTNQIIADGQTGVLIGSEPSREEALSRNLARLMGDEGLRRSLACGARARNQGPTLEAVLDHWDSLIDAQSRSHGFADWSRN